MPFDDFDPLFETIYPESPQAALVAKAILHILHTWDDLIDKDKPIEDKDINKAFVYAAIDLNCSPLWDHDLAFLLRIVYFKWQAANEIEKDKDSSDNDLAKAWMLRASCYDLFIALSCKVNGPEVAESHGALVYKHYGEPLESFIKEVRKCQIR